MEDTVEEVVDDRPYKIDNVVVKFMADNYIIENKDFSYLKYRVQYTNKKDFEGHFENKTRL